MLSSAEQLKSKYLDEILEPVQSELNSLEKGLIDSVASSNSFVDRITGYIIQSGGKRLRPAITFLIAKALNNGYVSANHFDLGIALELIHTATLIHDDVIDEAETRRGVETISRKCGDKTAIIAGDYLLSKSLTKLAAIKSSTVIEIFANIMSEICEGEIQQDSLEFSSVSIDQYIEKSKRKTAKLFIAGAECAAVLTPKVDNLVIRAVRDYALNLGIAFQIIDDVLNFTSSEKELGKPIGLDLKEGIITAPVIFALQEYEENNDNRLAMLISEEFNSEESFNLALEMVLNSQGIDKSINLAKGYADMASRSLTVIEDNLYKEALKQLADYVIYRKN